MAKCKDLRIRLLRVEAFIVESGCLAVVSVSSVSHRALFRALSTCFEHRCCHVFVRHGMHLGLNQLAEC